MVDQNLVLSLVGFHMFRETVDDEQERRFNKGDTAHVVTENLEDPDGRGSTKEIELMSLRKT